MRSSPRLPSRRRLLQRVGVLGSGLVTGCFSPQMGGSVDEISIYNATTGRIDVSLEVHELPNENRIIDDTFTLSPEDARDYPQPFAEDGTKRLTIVVNGSRHSTYEWTADAATDGTGVDIVVHEDEIDIDQISA